MITGIFVTPIFSKMGFIRQILGDGFQPITLFLIQKFFISNATTSFCHLTNNLEIKSDKLSLDQKEELSSSRPLCNRNDGVSGNCKNEDMFNVITINNPCDTPSILNKLKLRNINRLVWDT